MGSKTCRVIVLRPLVPGRRRSLPEHRQTSIYHPQPPIVCSRACTTASCAHRPLSAFRLDHATLAALFLHDSTRRIWSPAVARAARASSAKRMLLLGKRTAFLYDFSASTSLLVHAAQAHGVYLPVKPHAYRAPRPAPGLASAASRNLAVSLSLMRRRRTHDTS